MPIKVSYPPEVWMMAWTTTATEGGTEVFSISSIAPGLVVMKTLATERHQKTKIKVAADGIVDAVDSYTISRYDIDKHSELSIPCSSSLRVNLFSEKVAGNIANQRVRLSYLVTDSPTIFQKVAYNLPLTDEEKGTDLYRDIRSGIIKPIPPVHDKIYEISTELTKSADENPTVGHIIRPPSSYKAALLSLSCEMANLTPHTVYVNITQDNRPDLLSLDAFAIPPLNSSQPCYMPALNQLIVSLKNTVNISKFRIRYRYAYDRITIDEKQRWKLPLTEEEKVITGAM